ncbi:hypothetical protein TorRG33x02_064210 [Trema orientale]|uniref:Uncharacterized protein n=1 Tax=Trema orientale TaxID=63057 RepID=A0A2P5FJ55_TREOI|nr:hypothetical protein TorRG33x02_064210 [Trema orientale]
MSRQKVTVLFDLCGPPGLHRFVKILSFKPNLNRFADLTDEEYRFKDLGTKIIGKKKVRPIFTIMLEREDVQFMLAG